MILYGLQKTTLLEYPGHIATVVFTGGCNMRCPYCHNPELVQVTMDTPNMSEEDFFEFLNKRKGVLEAVSISGGEPLLHGEDLLLFIDKLKNRGLKVKLDTNGTFPKYLKKANVDYIAMDIKTSLSNYHKVNFNSDNISAKIKESIQYILEKGIDYEFRTTVAPGIIDESDLDNICTLLNGTSNYVLSQFRPNNTLDESMSKVKPYNKDKLEEMKDYCITRGIPTTVRANYG